LTAIRLLASFLRHVFLTDRRGEMSMSGRTVPFAIAICVAAIALPAEAEGQARLLRNPAVSANHLAFVYANDISFHDTDGKWAVESEGVLLDIDRIRCGCGGRARGVR